jgi:hypothetical protein
MFQTLAVNSNDLRAFAGKLGDASGHATVLSAYAGTYCTETAGMDGVMALIRPIVTDLAEANGTVLNRISARLDTTAVELGAAADDYDAGDTTAADGFATTFPDPPDYFRTFPALEPPLLDLPAYEPNPAAPTYTATRYVPEDIDVDDWIGQIEQAWQEAYGESLIGALVEPLIGDPGRLAYLAEAYTQLGTGTYQVAWNLRYGSYNLGQVWEGDAYDAFGAHMFKWHMGLGGLGDVHALFAKLFTTLRDTIVDGVEAARELINQLIDRIFRAWLRKYLNEEIGYRTNPFGSLTGDPCNPRVIVFVVWTNDDMSEFLDAVNAVKERIEQLQRDVERLIDSVRAVLDSVEMLLSFLGHPFRNATDAVRQAAENAQRGVFEFESAEWYDPAVGAGRVLLLPI